MTKTKTALYTQTLYRFPVVIEKDRDGYFAFCPELQGCYTQGDSYEEVMENIKDAIRLRYKDHFRKKSYEERTKGLFGRK